MPVRLCALDLDGTVVGADRLVSPRVRAAIVSVQRRGIPVIAVTARRWFAAAPIIRDLDLVPIAVVAGGGALRDVRSGTLVDVALLEPATVDVAVRCIAGAGLSPMVGVDGAEAHLAGPAERDTPAAALYLSRGRVDRRAENDLVAPAVRVLAMGEEAPARRALQACAGLHARLILQECIVQIEGAPLQWELHVAAADKGDGLRSACRHLGVDCADVLAVGDSPGDLPMLAVAGRGVLMGPHDALVEDHGFVRAPAVGDDGCAWALETLC